MRGGGGRRGGKERKEKRERGEGGEKKERRGRRGEEGEERGYLGPFALHFTSKPGCWADVTSSTPSFAREFCI